MKFFVLALGSALFLSACVVPDPEPIYIERPVQVHHHNVKSDDSFQAVEKPSSYSSKAGEY